MLLEADGSLWTWGHSWMGQLGSYETYTTMPAQILANVTYVASGGRFAILDDHSLWGWGIATNGYEDNQNALLRHIPPKHLMDDVAAVLPRDYRNFVIRTDGSLWALGDRWQITGINWMDRYLVPNLDENEPVWLMDSVIGAYSTMHVDFVLQCCGSLWYLIEDEPIFLMYDVIAVYPPISGHVSWPPMAYVLQADGRLWGVGLPLLRGGIETPFLHAENVKKVYRTPRRDYILHSDNSLNALVYGNHILDDVEAVYSSNISTFAITTSGELWGWLGWGETGPYPVRIMENVVKLALPESWPQIAGQAIMEFGDTWADRFFVICGYGYLWDLTNTLEPVRIAADVAAVFSFPSGHFMVKTWGEVWQLGRELYMGNGHFEWSAPVLIQFDTP